MKRILWISPGIASIIASAAAFPVLAASSYPVITNTAGIRSEICNVFTIMFEVLIAVSVIMVLWAAYLYATAGDDTEQVTQARRALFYAAIGLVVAFAAKGFPFLVASIFPSGTSGIQGC
jgi:uncharacterized membrane protein